MRLVDAILELDRHAQHYQVRVRPDEALAFAKRSEEYNNITNDNLVSLISVANEAIPPMQFGPSNQNTGKPHHHFNVGNEGSRVIYCEVQKWYLPKGFACDDLGCYLVAIGNEALADESDITRNDGSYLTVRWWWD